MDLPMILCSGPQVIVDDGYRHDIENTTGIFVLVVGEFVIASPVLIGRLDLTVYLAAKWPFEVHKVFLMRVNRRSNRLILRLFFRHLPDIERLLVGNVELLSNLVD